jgi:hypothetical protein
MVMNIPRKVPLAMVDKRERAAFNRGTKDLSMNSDWRSVCATKKPTAVKNLKT